MRNPLIAQQIFNTPLLIHSNKLDAIIYGLQERFGVNAEKPEPGLFTTQQGERKEGGYRVIDGVAGAQFTQFLSTILTDIRHILL